MYVDFFSADRPVSFTPPRLSSVYHLKADASYHVNHLPLPSETRVLVLTTGGSGHIQWKDHSLTLFGGEALLFSPEEKTFQYYTCEDVWEFWWFEFIDQTSENWTDSQPFFYNDLISGMCTSCLECFQSNHPEAACAMFSSILTQIKLQCDRLRDKDAQQNELFFKIQEIIRQNLQTITVASAAAKTGIGERSMRDLFDQHIGCSPKQYILMLKLDTACYLLRNTNKSIEEISDSLGFSSQFHFSRSFKQHFGAAPSVWRRETQ